MTRISFKDSYIDLMTTLKDIQNTLYKMRSEISEKGHDESIHSPEFNNELFKLLTELEIELVHHKLPLLSSDWYFAITIDNHDACINLRHLYNTEEYDGYDETYTLINVPVKTYSSAEYAQLLGINEVTVRQWIRRGKLRSAYKVGNDWRIPVLTEKPKRGFTNVTYYLRKTYVELSQYGCIAMHPNHIEIKKTAKAGEYMLIADGIQAFYTLKEQDREKLEHKLIEEGIPNSDNLFLGYPAREEPDHIIPILRIGSMRK